MAGSGAVQVWGGAVLAVVGVADPVARATAAGALLCLLGWAAWLLSGWDAAQRRRDRMFPREEQRDGPWARLRGGGPWRVGRWSGTRPPPELLLLPLGLLAAWPTHSPLVAALAAGAVVPAIRLRRRRRASRVRGQRRTAVVALCAALAGELRTGATPHQAVEMAAAEFTGSGELTASGEFTGSGESTVAGEPVLDCTVLLAAVRYGGGVPEAFRVLAGVPGAEGAAGIAACWQVASSSGAGLAAGLDRVAEGLRAERALRETVRAELAGPRSTAGLLALLPVFGLLLGPRSGPIRCGCCCTPRAGCSACCSGRRWSGRAGLDRTNRAGRGSRGVGRRERRGRGGWRMDLSVIWAALLSGVVALLLGLLRAAAGRRLRGRARAVGLPLEPPPGWWRERGLTLLRSRRSGWSPRLVRGAASLLLGAGLALFTAGAVGLLLGVLAGAAGYRWLPEPPTAQQRRRRRESSELRDQLPLTADLLAGCLSSWCAPAEAAEAVAAALGGPMGSRLARVAAEIRTGADAEESWGRFGADPVLGPLGRCLVRAAASGAPPAAGLARLAEGARTAAATAAQGRVRRAGVLAAAPLGLCFLPAFVLIGVVPVVTGLAGSFLVRI
ncbi:type II secretion system F family protein [Streptacidiphilus sp. PAMC 29251]